MKKLLSLLLSAALVLAALPTVAFAETGYPIGDVDFDGSVAAEDLTALAKQIGGIRRMETLGFAVSEHGDAFSLGDVDFDGEVDAADLTGLAKHVGGILPISVRGTAYEIEEPPEAEELCFDLNDEDGGSYSVSGGYGENGGSVIIPATHNDLPVTNIGDYGFDYQPVERVVIPEGVTEIGEYAFYQCTSLTEVVLPKSLKVIHCCAFAGCTALKSVTLPAGLKVIEDGAFESCSSLKSIVIPSSVEVICDSAFNGCNLLKNITLPDSVTKIGMYAFERTAYYDDETNWDNGVLYIGKHLIRAAGDITSCVIREGTLTVSDYAFGSCDNLGALQLGGSADGVASASSYGGYYAVPENAFDGDRETAWESVGDENEWIALQTDAPLTLSSLAVLWNFDIPDEYRVEISSDGVNWTTPACTLERADRTDLITFTPSVTASRIRVFVPFTQAIKHIVSVSEILVNPTVTFSPVIVPDSVTHIGENAFRSCSGMRSLHLGKGVKEIGEYAFSYCGALMSITVDPANPVYRSENNCLIERATNRLLLGCSASVIPDGVTSIADETFLDCAALTALSLPASVTEFDPNTFYGCTGLTSLTVDPASTVYRSENNCIIEKATDRLVFGCKTSTIPASVKVIGEYAFRGCTGLKSVTVPATVEKIEGEAFQECTALASVTLPDTPLEIGSYVFEDTAYYNNEANWEDGILYIGKHLIKAKREITSCVIREGTLTVAGAAFSGCCDLGAPTPSGYVPETVRASSNAEFSSPTLAFDGDTSTFWESMGSENEWISFSWDKPSPLKNLILRWSEVPVSYTVEVSDDGESWTPCAFSREQSGEIDTLTLTPAVRGKEFRVFIEIAGEKNTVCIDEILVDPVIDETPVVFPESLRRIGKSAFQDCMSLTHFDLPDDLEAIGEDAFTNTGYWNDPANMVGGALYAGKYLLLVDSSSPTFTVRDGTTLIADNAFFWYGGLRSIAIPQSVTAIGRYAFDSCAALEIITYGGTKAEWNAVAKGERWVSPLADYTVFFSEE